MDINNDDKEIRNNVKPLLWPQIIAALAGAITHVGMGTMWAYTGVMLPILTNENSTDLILTSSQAATFTSVNNIAQVIGAILCGFITSEFGQRITLLLLLPLGIVSWFIAFFSQSYIILLTSRIMQGILAAIYINACNNYIVEISHKTIRGRLLAVTDIFRQIGFLYISVLGNTELSWRSISLIVGLTTFLPPIIAYIFLPNSSRWLATKNRKEEAAKSLTFFRGKNFDVDQELYEIFKQIKDSPPAVKITDQIKFIVNHKLTLRRLLSMLMILLLSQFSGALVVLAYTTTIFITAESTVDPALSTTIASVIRVLAVLTYFVLADKFPRKYLLNVSITFSGISMLIMFIYHYVKDVEGLPVPGIIPVIAISIYAFSNSFYYPILILMRSEILPNTVRALGTAILYFALSIIMFVGTFIYPYMIDGIGSHWTFFTYASSSFLLIIFIMVFMPETKDKTLEEITDGE